MNQWISNYLTAQKAAHDSIPINTFKELIGDFALGISVSGNSPNCVKAMTWAKQNGLRTAALVGARRGRMADLADRVIVIADTHYGWVKDVQMTICHMLCYAFIEHPEWAE